MSSGRSQGRGGGSNSNRPRQTAQNRAAQQSQVGTGANRLAAEPPPPPPAAAQNSSMLMWGGVILVVLILAFLAILFLPGIFKSGTDPIPTPTALPGGSITPGSTSTSSLAGRIAFVRSDANGTRNLFVVNADGTNEQRVTDSIIVEGTVLWTPDGKSVVMQAGVEGVSRVVRVGVGPDNKLSDSAQLTADVTGDSAFPAVSPDGKMVAYCFKPTGGQFQVYVMNIDGSGKKMLSDGQGVATLPAWSPDSKSVMYVQGADAAAGSPREVWTVAIDGSPAKKITNTGVPLSYPAWSPDGKTLSVVELISDRESKLELMNTDGSNLRVVDEGLLIKWPYFSPKGDALAYYTITFGVGNDIHIYNIANNRHVNVAKNQSDVFQPAWSPDGTMLTWANQATGSGAHKIVIANLDGSNPKTITTGEQDDTQPVWGIIK